MSLINDPKILNQLNSFSLDEIQQGIDELENTIGFTRFGERYKDQLIILYKLKKNAEKKRLNCEVNALKNQLFERLAEIVPISIARSQTFNLWVKYKKQDKGAQYVRDSLQMELESLQLQEVLCHE